MVDWLNGNMNAEDMTKAVKSRLSTLNHEWNRYYTEEPSIPKWIDEAFDELFEIVDEFGLVI